MVCLVLQDTPSSPRMVPDKSGSSIKPMGVKEGIVDILTQFSLKALWRTGPEVTPEDSLPTGIHVFV